MQSLNIPTFIFYFFGICSLLLAIKAVTTDRLIRSVVYLMITLLLSGGFYLLLGAEFMAGVQILVYVGGIVVLMIFSIMLTGAMSLPKKPLNWKQKRPALFIAISLFSISVWCLSQNEHLRVQKPASMDSTQIIYSLGRSFLDYTSTGYVLPFEVISLLLLSSLIGGIVISKKEVKND